MDQLKLLRDYVSTMQRQIQSKNQQIKTLTEQNQALRNQNYQYSIKKSIVLTTSSNNQCPECPFVKNQVANLTEVYNLLQLKYNNLEKQRNASSTVRVISTSCTECIRVKKDYDELKIKYDELQRSSQLRSSATTKIYSTVVCTECPRLRAEINSKEDMIFALKNQLSTFNSKILTLQGQIHTLNATAPKPVIYTQAVSRQSDLQRITYLNGQVQQYIALVNSLRSEIKQLNQESHRYIYRIRELEQRPVQVQVVEKQLSSEIRNQMRALKIEIGELSNDNIVLRRENASLKKQIMNLQFPKSQVHIEMQKPYSSSVINMSEDRRGRHFRKSNISAKKGYEFAEVIQQKLPYQQRVKYDDISRKIELLQMENDYLRGTFYSQI